jgi:HlyD family secretion protein
MRILFICATTGLSLLAYWGVNKLAPTTADPTVDTYTLDHRSFKVTLRAKGELEASESIDIKSLMEGRSTIISLIKEGSQVEEGDLLVEMASDQVEDRLQEHSIQVRTAEQMVDSAETSLSLLKEANKSDIGKAALALELAQLELSRYLEGEWEQKIKDARLDVEQADLALQRAQDEVKRSKDLQEKNFITMIELRDDEFELTRAEAQFEKAQRNVNILESYTHVMDTKQRESDVEEAGKELERVRVEAEAKEAEQANLVQARKDELALKKDRLRRVEEQLKNSKIYAPSAGLVVYGSGGGGRHWDSEDQIKEGVDVRKNQTILRLPNTALMKVTMRVHEAKVGKIRIGLPANVVVEGMRTQHFTGMITNIAVLADSQNRWLNPELKEYTTEITLDQNEADLKPGATAHVEVLVDELADVLAVPIQCVYRRGHQTYLFVEDGKTAKPVKVTTGLASEEFVEVRNGVNPGDKILLAVSDDLRRELPQAQGRGASSSKSKAAHSAPKATSGRPAAGKQGGSKAAAGHAKRGKKPNRVHGASE